MSDTGMDRKKAMAAFKTYTERFDTADINIKLKIDHTYRVAGIAERIARSLELDELGVDFCWLLGLLHDIGRFEQLTRYGTFKDAESVDHAELGADILFSASAGANGTAGAIGTVGEPLINTFIDPSDWLDPEIPDFGGWDEMAGMCETAIRFHNKLALPDDLDSATLMYSNVLRDADKADIFRVLTEPPYDKRNERIIQCSQESITATPARDDVMRCVREHRCVPKRRAAGGGLTPQSDFLPDECAGRSRGAEKPDSLPDECAGRWRTTEKSVIKGKLMYPKGYAVSLFLCLSGHKRHGLNEDIKATQQLGMR